MKPTVISDVAISELSLVFSTKDGKAYRPINPEATIILTKSGELPRATLLGKYAKELTRKSEQDAQAEAELQVAYSTITSVIFAAIDDLHAVSYAPETFTVAARKDAIKTVVDNMVTAIADASSVVLKAKAAEISGEDFPGIAQPSGPKHQPEPIIAGPPYQADPASADAPEPQPSVIVEPVTPTPEEAPPSDNAALATHPTPPEQADKAGQVALQALIADMQATTKAQFDLLKEELAAKSREVVESKRAAADAQALAAAVVNDAREPTAGAIASRKSARPKKTVELPPNATIEQSVSAILNAAAGIDD